MGAARTQGNFLAVQDAVFLDAVLIELALIMWAIETGTFDEVNKAQQAADKHITALRAPAPAEGYEQSEESEETS
jgi:hypothetical protein